MEPAALERLGRRLGLLVVALHHVVAAHHDLAQRLAVLRDVVHLVVDHAHEIGDDVALALAGQQAGPLLVGRARPTPGATRTRCAGRRSR